MILRQVQKVECIRDSLGPSSDLEESSRCARTRAGLLASSETAFAPFLLLDRRSQIIGLRDMQYQKLPLHDLLIGHSACEYPPGSGWRRFSDLHP